MNGWLLDTDVLSELCRRRPQPKVQAFIAARPLDLLYISVVTLAEIRFGIEVATDPTHRSSLLDWLTNTLRPMFDGRVLPVSEDVMLKWRVLVEAGRKVRHTFPQPDLIIAATALHHGLTCVTRNTKDFEKTGARLVNPWRA